MEGYYDRDAPRERQSGALRTGVRVHRKHGAAPYARVLHMDREGDAQMGEGSASGAATQRVASFNPRGGQQAHRSRSLSVALPAEKNVFSRLGPKNLRMARESFSVRNRGRGRPLYGSRPPVTAWFKVRLVGAATVDRSWVMNAIGDRLSAENVTFQPIQVAVDGNSLTFFVKDQAAADKLKMLNKVIQFSHGPKMPIGVNPSQAPVVHLDESVKDAIRTAMGKRYDAATRSLTLSLFNEAPEFKIASLSIQLSRTSHMKAVLELIETNIKDLHSLDLSKNRLTQLMDFFRLADKVQLHQLNLSDNAIRNIRDVELLRSFTHLVDLDLSRNPIRDAYRDTPAYIEDVRKKLPNLLRLDGVDLPKKIGFDAPTRVQLPVPTQFHAPNEQAKQQLTTFIQQYYTYFDGRRSELLGAYSDDAQFSLFVPKFQDKSSGFFPHSRNLNFVVDSATRNVKLLLGRTSIVEFFSKLPATAHVPESFTVDVFFNENALVGFMVTGVFREEQNKHQRIRSFSRNFVVVISDEGLRILSDTLTVSQASPEQVNQFSQNTPSEKPSSSVATPATTVLDEQTKLAMIVSFASQSGMNEHYSRLALEDWNWDYPKAGAAFLQLKSENKLPPEAFVK
ncbi:nuclear RNA export factor 1-like [Paramacrobiotus metropolitanus]|uniref:nuclear RNA export factor 1-like n=1 Tax=Paramacrobiotus metropolitanus TaxID=2943436 RepID=UPI0024458141|nr:nuclear RNA export factor 1-like [Paramacrobiotus metropolitanus]XP_055340935.1 nuclear RNA export factor 1-like [Paramacrobiotus metropolitanus]XP_055340944.1 nuclear RNA export factor 1-like [Paramacrobiotus metropolitanus]